MSQRLANRNGVTSCRRVALSLATTTLLIGAEAHAGEPVAAEAEVRDTAVTEAAITTDAAAATEAGADDQSREIVVTGSRYRINTLNSRLPDLRDAPQSITVIPREVIEQQSASSLRDVLRNVSGISMSAGEGGGGPAGDNLTLRGFAARNDIFVDGIRDFASYTRDTFNIEQVEVVKGPSSAQTGRGSTGGYINLFTKQPMAETFVGGTLGIGAPGFIRATGDINLGGEELGLGGTAVRLNALYQDGDTPGRDYVETERYGLAPSISVGLGSSTRAIASLTWMKQDNVPDYGIPFVPATNTALPEYADEPAPVDYDNYYGLLERDYEKLQSSIATFALEHDLTDNIRLANTTRYGHATRDSIYSAPRFVSNDSTLINPQTQSRDTVDEILLNQSNLFAKFGTGTLSHDLIAGFEISEEKSRNQLRAVTPGTPTDLFDPEPTRPWHGTVEDIPGAIVRAKADTVAGYIFDTIHFSEQFLATGGIRYERYKTKYQGAPPAPKLGRTDENLTWRAGVTWKPVRRLSLYAGAGTSVNPSIENMTQTNVTPDLAALEPERSRTYEVGAKWDGFDGRLLLNAAIFRTDKVNARTDGLPGEPAVVLAGKQRVDGFELGATGRLTERWSIIAGYAYLDSEILESNDPAEVGNRLRNVPDHSGSLWTTYELPRGFEIGGGVRYVGERFTNETNARRLEGYWLADATAAYDISSRLTLRLNAFNLFDKRYADQIGGGHFIPGPGRSILATLAFRQ